MYLFSPFFFLTNLPQKNSYQHPDGAYYDVILEDKKPKGMTVEKMKSIKEYFWKNFSSRFASKYCSESMEDNSDINLLQFTRNDKFLLVITRSLHAWILDTEAWATLNSIDLKKLKYKSSPDGPHNFDKVFFISIFN